jgi:class 3 adenylate cyclase
MLTSLELIQAAGISRATLNNYISQGLIPRPVVQKPGAQSASRARQIGFFPQETVSLIKQIQQLKKSGRSMAEVASQLQGVTPGIAQDSMPAPKTANREAGRQSSAGQHISQPNNNADVRAPIASTGELRLTIDQVPYASYMVNYNFEIIWYNDMANRELLGNFAHLPGDIRERNALSYLLKSDLGQPAINREAILQFHIMLSKGRLSRNDLLNLIPSVQGETADVLNKTSKFAEAYPSGSMTQLPLSLYKADGALQYYSVFASYYREGILFVYVPGSTSSDNMTNLLSLLERRDEVIRNLLKKRLPVLTDVAVLVADLQNSTRICTELPPEEYFELINQIWATMEPIFRKYYGTHGKHVGDGMVHYFFPQPDCSYILNALVCAHEIKAAMRKISKEWQIRKNWLNELYLNTGLNEGQEWLGVFHSQTKVEFTVLGDTINHAARLSDFARSGTIWATKNLLGKLSTAERQRIDFGIKRKGHDGKEMLVGSSYSRITELLDLRDEKYEKLRDIAALPVTEILDIHLK